MSKVVDTTKDESNEHPIEDADNYCNTCNGSGEGMWDGSRCSSCKGLGRLVDKSDDMEEPNYPPDDFYEYDI